MLRQDVRNVATLRQDVRNVATQVRTHRTHGTQNIRRLRQDATSEDQTQDPFFLMPMVENIIKQLRRDHNNIISYYDILLLLYRTIHLKPS